MTERVELHPAHMWDCPGCGRENFCRSVTYKPEPGDDIRASVAASMGMQPFEVPEEMAAEGFWMTAPSNVACSHCGMTFEVERDEEDA